MLPHASLTSSLSEFYPPFLFSLPFCPLSSTSKKESNRGNRGLFGDLEGIHFTSSSSIVLYPLTVYNSSNTKSVSPTSSFLLSIFISLYILYIIYLLSKILTYQIIPSHHSTFSYYSYRYPYLYPHNFTNIYFKSLELTILNSLNIIEISNNHSSHHSILPSLYFNASL